MTGGIERFAYHRSISPTLGVLLALALLETAVIHLVAVALWGWGVALLLGALDLSLVVALVGLLRAIRRYPVTIADGVLTMRIGRLKVIPIPLDRITGLRERWDAAALKEKGVVNLALANWPNVMIGIDPPVTLGRREIHAVAHKLDDAPTFVAALTRLTGKAR